MISTSASPSGMRSPGAKGRASGIFACCAAIQPCCVRAQSMPFLSEARGGSVSFTLPERGSTESRIRRARA